MTAVPAAETVPFTVTLLGAVATTPPVKAIVSPPLPKVTVPVLAKVVVPAIVFDPAYRGKISVSNQVSTVDYNAFEGMEIQGRPEVVTLRGQVAARDGRFTGTPGRGKFLPRPLSRNT